MIHQRHTPGASITSNGPTLFTIEKQKHMEVLAEAVENGDLPTISRQREKLVNGKFVSEETFWALVDVMTSTKGE